MYEVFNWWYVVFVYMWWVFYEIIDIIVSGENVVGIGDDEYFDGLFGVVVFQCFGGGGVYFVCQCVFFVWVIELDCVDFFCIFD